jgi:hypothetical protein
MKSKFNKLFLLIALTCLFGFSKSMAKDCFITNPLNCKLELQVEYLLDCDGDNLPDIPLTSNIATVIVPANSTINWCPPTVTTFPGPNGVPCKTIITGYFIKNSVTGEIQPLTQQGVAQYSFEFLPSFQFENGPCGSRVYLSYTIDAEGNSTLKLNNDEYAKNCGPYCFTNNTDFTFEIRITINNGILSCEGVPPTKVTSDPLALRPGNHGCIRQFIDPATGCIICPGEMTIQICNTAGTCFGVNMQYMSVIFIDPNTGSAHPINLIYDGNGNYRLED